jgi:triosephosphate isomerase
VGLCAAERAAGKTEEVLARQIATGLALRQLDDAGRIAIAYEPVWAIGTGRTATPDIAQETIGFIRKRFADAAGDEAAQAVRVLYGGSVRPDNIDELMAQPDVDGVLVGGASLKVGVRRIGYVVP